MRATTDEGTKLMGNAVPIAELLPKNSDIKLLLEVLQRMGLKVRETDKYLIFHNDHMEGFYDKASGEIKTWGLERLDISEVRRAYSEELANHQAKRDPKNASHPDGKALRARATPRCFRCLTGESEMHRS